MAMTLKITVIYENPDDASKFEAGYPDHVALAQKIPGVQHLQSSKVAAKEDGSPTPFYRILGLSFADYVAASAAVGTEEAAAFFPSVFALATGGARIAFA